MQQPLDPSVLPTLPAITTITLAELSVGPHVASNDTERAARQAHLQQAESDFEAIALNAAAARAFGRVSSNLRSSGHTPRARTYDALIASMAITQGLPMYTANPDDFKGINELQIVELPVPKP